MSAACPSMEGTCALTHWIRYSRNCAFPNEDSAYTMQGTCGNRKADNDCLLLAVFGPLFSRSAVTNITLAKSGMRGPRRSVKASEHLLSSGLHNTTLNIVTHGAFSLLWLQCARILCVLRSSRWTMSFDRVIVPGVAANLLPNSRLPHRYSYAALYLFIDRPLSWSSERRNCGILLRVLSTRF